MKRLITLVLLISTLFTFGQSKHLTDSQIDSIFSVSQKYKSHFWRDGGDLQNDRDFKLYLAFAELENMAESIEFAWFGQAATKQRKDGIYSYATKLYEIYNFNDATQTTATNQPYISGNIAPNEKLSLKNPNGDARFMTHPTISFSSMDEWSVSIVAKYNFGPGWQSLFGGNGRSSFDLVNGVRLLSSNGMGVVLHSSGLSDYYGKNIVISVVYRSTTLDLYVNGTLLNQASHTGYAFDFNRLFSGRYQYSYPFNGNISAHIIRSEALTPEQVAAESLVLRDLYPEIPSVKIGDYNVATSVLEMVASTNGTVITQATDNTDWATGAARWCYHSNSTQTGAIYGKIYNKAARDIIIANPPDGWHVATEEELTKLATYNEALMIGRTDYWTANVGTNTTGFSAIGGGSRNADGTFNTLKESVSFWCADSDKVLNISNTGTATIEAATANEGHYIRLIQDN